MSKLIKISDTHYIIVDNSNIKNSDWYYDSTDKDGLLPIYRRTQDLKYYSGCLKITHSTEPLEKDTSYSGSQERPVLHYCDIVQITIAEIEEVIYGYNVQDLILKKIQSIDNQLSLLTLGHLSEGAYIGFGIHRELTKDKLFTLDDMKQAHRSGIEYGKCLYSQSNYNHELAVTTEQYIQSLLLPEEWNIKFINGKIKLI